MIINRIWFKREIYIEIETEIPDHKLCLNALCYWSNEEFWLLSPCVFAVIQEDRVNSPHRANAKSDIPVAKRAQTSSKYAINGMHNLYLHNDNNNPFGIPFAIHNANLCRSLL